MHRRGQRGSCQDMVTTQVWEVENIFVALLGKRQRNRPGSWWDVGLSLGHVNSKVPSGFVLLGRRPQLGVWGVNTKSPHKLKAAGRKLAEMDSMNVEGTWDDRIRNTGAHEAGGRAEERRGHSSWIGGKDRPGEAGSKRWSQDLSSRAGLPPLSP